MLKESIWTWIYELQKKRGNSMLLGLDGVEIGLIIVFVTLFAAILSGFPVAFAIGGAGVIAFAIIAFLDGQGLLIHQLKELLWDSEERMAVLVLEISLQ